MASLLPTLFLSFTSCSYAAPAPLGFELGEVTLKDLQAMGLLEKGYTGCDEILRSYILSIPNLIDLDGAYTAYFRLDAKGLLQGVRLAMSEKKYDEVFKVLSEKYKLVDSFTTNNRLPFSPSKRVLFSSGNYKIELTTQDDGIMQVEYYSEVLKKRCDMHIKSGKSNKLL
ncbi:hypothetical protein [Candidatus Paracaedibacter symbiosus]|uniref:hypothetical protein n=1 Tax=Candidatus Paracaedibacter symbiosus TaxID=244582 RepID=UPI001E3FEC3B|nr:hypothetical protein [Candidatus Paracaedibacter symbiosus]